MKVKSLTKYLWLLVLLCYPSLALSYTLTEADYQTLKTDITITHQAEFAEPVANNDFQTIANAYNLVGTPDCWVWRTTVPEQDNYEVTTDLPSTWDWDIFAALQQGNREGWIRMFAATGKINAALDNNRAALDKLFKAPATAQATHVRAVWRRKALRGERLYVTPQTGACSPNTPAKLTWEGPLSYSQINYALTGSGLP